MHEHPAAVNQDALCAAGQSGRAASSVHGPSLRPKTLRFVVVFLATAFFLLTACRYAIGTDTMNAYLYVVARSTAWVLERVGHACSVENPSIYRGHEAEIRAQNATWVQGEEPQDVLAVSSAIGEPLTPWEVWQHRYLRHRRNMAIEKARLALLESHPQMTGATAEECLVHIREQIGHIEDAINSPNRQSPMYPDAPATLPERLGKAKRNVDALLRDVSADPAGNVSAHPVRSVHSVQISAIAARQQILQTAALDVEALRLDLVRFVQDRLDGLRAQLLKIGPTVHYVAKASANRESADGGPGKPAYSFRFQLAPDCGALESMALFLAAVMAFPSRWRHRLAGSVLGIAFLYVVNVVRLACLAVLGALVADRGWFDFAHKYVWQGAYVVFVVVAWLLWIEFIGRGKSAWRSAG